MQTLEFHFSAKLQNLYNFYLLILFFLIVVVFKLSYSVWNATTNKLM